MGTIAIGNAAEAAVISALVTRELAVLTPFGDGGPYDVGVDMGASRMLRVQCKAARVKKGCVAFNSRSTDHGNGAGSYYGLADVFGVWCAERRSAYLVPVLQAPSSKVYLRLVPTQNNQLSGVRFAADYELERWSFEDLVQPLPDVGAGKEAQPLPA